MTLNNKFDAVIQTIVSNSSDSIEIKNELVRIFNGEKTYVFSNQERFDSNALISVILNTILEYREETKDYVRTLSEESIDTITNFDDLIKMVRYDDAGKIQLLIRTQPKITSIALDGLIDIYHTNKDFYFRKQQTIEQNNNQEERKVDNSDYENAMRSKYNLELLDKALSKTQEKGTIGRGGMNEMAYSDEQITFILTDLMNGSYKYITNSPLGEENKLRDKISKISRNEIFAEVLKNAIRVISMANNDRELSVLSSYDIMPVDIQRLSDLVVELTKDSLNDSNIDSVIENLSANEKFLLSKSFIMSRKDDLIKNKLLDATMGDKYHTLLISNLNKIGSTNGMGEDNFSK